MRRLLFAFLLAVPTFADDSKQAVIGSKHDLAATGGGPVKSATSETCLFCHAPHNALSVTPLWDHQLASQTYTTYSSSTYGSGPETPSMGSSKLCLSCHDGSVAPGLTVSKGTLVTSGAMAAKDVLGSNLSTSHPVSMKPTDDGQLALSLFGSLPASEDPAVRLVAGKVECTTCHDPHVPNNDPVASMFLVRSNSNGRLCLACHEPSRSQPNVMSGWLTSAHATASSTVPPSVGVGAYGTVAANACSSCHGAHQNAVGPRNLKGVEEAACSVCHGGTNVGPTLPNIMGEFNKAYRHPATIVSGAHDAAEALPVNVARHAECPDCHNPHAAAAQNGIALAPAIQASLAGVSGYDAAGPQKPATMEYQVCFKCHADSTNKPQNPSYMVYGRTASRYPQGRIPAGFPFPPPMPADQFNVRLQFTSAIGHNVLGNSISATTNRTLRPFMLNVDGSNDTTRPLSRTSQLYCTDCHNNDQARAFRGSGSNGPHGSSFQHLLQMNLFQEPAGGAGGNSSAGYALCNKCHNLQRLGEIAPHESHMRFGCTTCHDPHGVIGGNSRTNRAMMNFDTAIVSSTSTYFGFFYNGESTGQKGCFLKCHGKIHNPTFY